jgi:DNA invertase Pin-like site-specific DNA recombinase
MIYGYARVSTIEQTTAQQQLALEQYGCDRILLEHGTSGSTIERKTLGWLLNNVVAGDTVVVVRLDRLGRSLKHLIETIEYFGKSEVNFVSINSAKIKGVQFGQPFKLNKPQQQLLIELRKNDKSPKEICRLGENIGLVS